MGGRTQEQISKDLARTIELIEEEEIREKEDLQDHHNPKSPFRLEIGGEG